MTGPDPDALFPLAGFDNTVFLRPLLASRPDVPNIDVGPYSYYSDFDAPTQFFDRNVRYNFGFSKARLVIGSFCALAHGTTFIMADAMHALDGVSTFPFPIFGGTWSDALPLAEMPFPDIGSIIVGNDVWFGYESLVLPGVRIGNGAIVAARAVVTADVPDYAVVAGNPARVVKFRFDERAIEKLLALAWWQWPADALKEAIPLLVTGDVGRLEKFAAAHPAIPADSFP
jgi:virginiamycin A acetyltransferase